MNKLSFLFLALFNLSLNWLPSQWHLNKFKPLLPLNKEKYKTKNSHDPHLHLLLHNPGKALERAVSVSSPPMHAPTHSSLIFTFTASAKQLKLRSPMTRMSLNLMGNFPVAIWPPCSIWPDWPPPPWNFLGNFLDFRLHKHPFSSALCFLSHLFSISLVDSASSAQPGRPGFLGPRLSCLFFSVHSPPQAFAASTAFSIPTWARMTPKSWFPVPAWLMNTRLVHPSTSYSTCPTGCSKAGETQHIQVPTQIKLLHPPLPRWSSHSHLKELHHYPSSCVSQKLKSQLYWSTFSCSYPIHHQVFLVLPSEQVGIHSLYSVTTVTT